MKSALWRGRGYLGRTIPERRAKRSIRGNKVRQAVHISIRFQSEGQFNCGGRPTRPSAIFSASNRSPETVNVCARAPPNDIYIYIDTVLERVLEQRPTLKCICGAGLTTNFKFFPARSACTDTHKPIPTLAEWREHGFPPSLRSPLLSWNKVIALLTPIVPRKFRMTGLGCHFWPLCAPRLVVLCDRKTCNEVYGEVRFKFGCGREGSVKRKSVWEIGFVFSLFEGWIRVWEERIKLWRGISSLIFSLCKCSKGKKIKVIKGQ